MTVGALPRRQTLDRMAAFVRRDFEIARSYRASFYAPLVSAVLSLAIFRFISRLVGDAGVLRETGDYFSFVVVGIVLAHVLDGALSAPVAAARSDQVGGTLEALAAQPVSSHTLAMGWMAYPVIQQLARAVITFGVAVAMGLRLDAARWDAAIVTMLLAAVVFASIGACAAALVIAFQQGARATHWIAAGLAFVSGVYFPIELLPRWVAVAAEASPLTHAVRALRGALLHGEGPATLAGDIGALALAAVVLVPVSGAAVDRALAFARKRGTLSSY